MKILNKSFKLSVAMVASIFAAGLFFAQKEEKPKFLEKVKTAEKDGKLTLDQFVLDAETKTSAKLAQATLVIKGKKTGPDKMKPYIVQTLGAQDDAMQSAKAFNKGAKKGIIFVDPSTHKITGTADKATPASDDTNMYDVNTGNSVQHEVKMQDVRAIFDKSGNLIVMDDELEAKATTLKGTIGFTSDDNETAQQFLQSLNTKSLSKDSVDADGKALVKEGYKNMVYMCNTASYALLTAGLGAVYTQLPSGAKSKGLKVIPAIFGGFGATATIGSGISGAMGAGQATVSKSIEKKEDSKKAK